MACNTSGEPAGRWGSGWSRKSQFLLQYWPGQCKVGIVVRYRYIPTNSVRCIRDTGPGAIRRVSCIRRLLALHTLQA